jgi:predicted ferric reductase
MNFKVTYRIAGVVVILAGIKIYIKGWSSLYGFPVPSSTAIIICFFGVLIILSSFFNKKKVNEKDEMMICIECKEKYNAKSVQLPICPKCNGKLEDYIKRKGSGLKY